MINPYFGEFMISPIPLELSLNYCSHRCAYCFANLNTPNRRYNATLTHSQLANYKKRNTLTNTLLGLDYPVVVSNRCDPFSKNNYKISIPLLKQLTNLDIQVMIQTKGGFGVDDVLSFLPKSVWYVSISTLSDKISTKLEPGAPLPGDRLVMIEKIVKAGHPVVVGINPLVPEWLPEPSLLIEKICHLGVNGVWIERLHLNYMQEHTMTDKEREIVSPTIIKRAMGRYTALPDVKHYLITRQLASNAGLHIYSANQPSFSRFFDVFRETYRHTFPVLQDFINMCYISGLTPENLIDLSDWQENIGPMLPSGEMTLGHYLGATSRDLWRRRKIKNTMTFTDMLEIIWTDPKTKYSLVRAPSFAYAGEKVKNGWVHLTNTSGKPYLVFNRLGFRKYHYLV